jgi:arabinogalactan oligomer/maltooligosaccharide transport system permease protein
MKRAVWLLFFGLVALTFPAVARAAPALRLWHAYRGDEEKALAEIVARFSGPKVETLALPYDAFASKLAAAIPLGEGPDVFIMSHGKLGNFRARGIVADVGDAFESDSVFYGPAVAAVREGTVTWGVPLSQKCMALFVNDGLVQKVPADLEGIAELAPSFPKGTFALAYEGNNTYALATLFGAFGVELLTKDEQFGVVGPRAEASLKLALDLLSRGVVPEDADGALVTELFRSGKAAFAISGPWLAGDLGSAKGLKYHVEVLPRVRATGEPMRPLLEVETAMLSPQGAEKPEARALVRLLASKEAAEIRGRLARTLTARTDVPLPEGDALLRAFAEQAKVAVPMPSSRAMDAVWEPSNRAIRKVMRRDAPPDVALAEAKRRFDIVRRPLPERAPPSRFLLIFGGLLLVVVLVWLRKAKAGELTRDVKKSLPAYKYIAHAVIAVGVLVVAPLVVGAATSLFAGSGENLRFVSFANFFDILRAQGGPLLASGSFYLVLGVTLLWTAANLFFHVAIGTTLALLLSRPTLKLKAAYRVLLIVPWAVPSYVTALAWKGMFHRQFGAVTGLLLGLNEVFGTHLEPIAWFSKFSTAFTANVTTNVWLGFPFMMVVTLGALTGVPQDVLEAAEVDGATRWQRLWRVTLPMIRPTMAPAITLGGIWTFNMFNVVFLVSGGDPDGTTDILVSEAYRWAFTREAQYGYAAAYSVLIFVLLFGFTRWNEHRAKRADERERAAAERTFASGAAT